MQQFSKFNVQKTPNAYEKVGLLHVPKMFTTLHFHDIQFCTRMILEFINVTEYLYVKLEKTKKAKFIDKEKN